MQNGFFREFSTFACFDCCVGNTTTLQDYPYD